MGMDDRYDCRAVPILTGNGSRNRPIRHITRSNLGNLAPDMDFNAVSYTADTGDTVGNRSASLLQINHREDILTEERFVIVGKRFFMLVRKRIVCFIQPNSEILVIDRESLADNLGIVRQIIGVLKAVIFLCIRIVNSNFVCGIHILDFIKRRTDTVTKG